MSNDIARTERRTVPFWAAVRAAALVAAVVGAGTGALMAKIAPDDKFSWVGLAVAPLWLLLEIVFEILVGAYELHSKTARVAGIVALLLSFYVTWFAMRPL